MRAIYTYLTDEDYVKFRKKCEKLGLKPQQLIFLLLSKTLGYDEPDKEQLLLDWEIGTRGEAEEQKGKKVAASSSSLAGKLVTALEKSSPQSTAGLQSAVGRKDRMVYRTLWENKDTFEQIAEPPRRAEKGKTGGHKRGRRPSWWQLKE